MKENSKSTKPARARGTGAKSSQVALQAVFLLITTVLWAVTAFLLTLWPIMLALSVASCISLVLQMFELPVRTKRRAGEIVRDIHSGRLTAEEAMEQL